MFRRTFWFTAGAAAGVWATSKAHAKLRKLAPESLVAQAADRAVEAGGRLRAFAADVRDGMAAREAELDEALGLTSEPPALPAPRRPALEAGREAPRVIEGRVEPADPERPRDPGRPVHPNTPNNRNEDH
ncbi:MULTISPECIES: hypothetical protein [Streptomyces]|uniref:Secreted protein n=1 Tax=Streptomyces evansiae TaxID=3075535 RepID=A0ABU2R233_9ACTN|nr:MULTISPECIES: hypothetical protein [unclassified Streptomyces]MDT0410758.1 hypothetical protein [Streptomyces sp. DSM 41979]MYQ61287.1 hypothetical protein [Streptomyces sp. SID4926]WEH26414.1 hypothetical protein P0D76_03245 [Streptomyces sp. AM 3-1-1]SCE35272.1 hypothetical protein GA0115252_142927 [Streptomyces sp. DfronAA-171]